MAVKAATSAILTHDSGRSNQSWKEHTLLCYINHGRAVEGGTHEDGLRDALDQLYEKAKLPRRPKSNRNGLVGIMSLQYPDTIWGGCIKARIGNPELRGMVRDLVVRGAMEWLQGHPDVARQLQHLQTFTFPDVWYV